MTRVGGFHGLALGSDLVRFSSIPYAEPPIGELRFAPPQKKQAEQGVREAARPSPIALQNPPRLQGVTGGFSSPQSEDCLHLTVWAPVSAQGLPVLFWLHGGAFLTGGGALDWYDGSLLAREGKVIVVSPNYRLGALGFLRSPGLADGNMGLLDAELALQWVRENIADFGGDPGRITVMGQSAGGWIASLLVARMPMSSPSIQRLIMLSAPLSARPATTEQAEKIGAAFLENLHEGNGGIAAGRDDIPRRRQGSEILSAQDVTVSVMGPRYSRKGQVSMPFGPVADGAVLPLPDDYETMMVRAAAKVPVLLGWTQDEMRAFAGVQSLTRDEASLARYTEDEFVRPAKQWAGDAVRQGQDAYAFCLDWSPLGSRLGACHGMTSPFVFGNVESYLDAPMMKGADAAVVHALSRRMRRALLAFIAKGDPSAGSEVGFGAWPKYALSGTGVMRIGANSV